MASWSRNRAAKILTALSGVACDAKEANFPSQLYPSCTHNFCAPGEEMLYPQLHWRSKKDDKCSS